MKVFILFLLACCLTGCYTEPMYTTYRYYPDYYECYHYYPGNPHPVIVVVPYRWREHHEHYYHEHYRHR